MPDTPSAKHTRLDDAQGIVMGAFMAGIGLHILTTAGLVTGQTAGIAVIVSYLTDWSFGAAFFVINLPFYVLAYFRLGSVFTLKSILCVTVLSVVSAILPGRFEFAALSPWLAALAFGSVSGAGLLALFRHGGSLGGLGVVALIVQDRTGFRAGYVQLIADAAIFAVAAFLFPVPVVLWSLLGALVLNLVIAVNHRRDRYVAT